MNSSVKHPWRYQINESSFAYYWQKGAGVPLLKKLHRKPDLKQADHFIKYLYAYDKEADAVATQLHLKIGFVQAQKKTEAYLNNTLDMQDDAYEILHRFIQPMKIYADAFDISTLRHGVALSQRSAITGLVVLRDYCLMGGYESAAINKPLIYTGALKKGAVKRISETVEFWVNITDTDALRYGNIGFESIVKTRLIHAFARVNILQHTDWDVEKWGYPLNTWDMLATNLGFSLVYLVGLRRMGFNVTKEESDGIFQLWTYVGYLLGIPPELLPATETDAIEALYYWTMTQAAGDADSLSLAHALQEEPLYAYHPKSQRGKKMMREVHLFYNHFLLGKYSCKLLGLDKTRIGSLAFINILKNKFDNRQLHNPHKYNKLVSKGRSIHEFIRKLYLENIANGLLPK